VIQFFELKMINCKFFSYVHYATPPELRSCAYLNSLSKWGLKNKCGDRARLRLHNGLHSQP